MRALAAQLLGEAGALRAAFPDPSALRAVAVSHVPPDGGDALLAALGYLRDEMLLVRDGTAGTLAVLDDEASHVRRVLAGRPPTP